MKPIKISVATIKICPMMSTANGYDNPMLVYCIGNRCMLWETVINEGCYDQRGHCTLSPLKS